MKTMRAVRFKGLKLVITGLLAYSGLAFAADPAGLIVKLKGAVTIEGGKAGKKPAVEGDKFFVGDTFVTGGDGRVKLRFAEGGPAGKNEVVIASSSRLFIEKAGSQASGKSGTSLALTEGSIRSNVKKTYSGEGEDVFKVRTPNAVAGVRGTIFLMNFDKKSQASTLLTQKGKVEFAIGATKSMVGAGQAITGKGNSAGKVEAAAQADLPGDFKELEAETSGPAPAGGGESTSFSDSPAAEGGTGDAPPAAMDRETVVTKDESAGTSGPGATADAGRAPAGDGSVSPGAPAAEGPKPAGGGILDQVAAPRPPPPPIFAPPTLYVPPISPVTVQQIQQLSNTGKVRIPITDFPD